MRRGGGCTHRHTVEAGQCVHTYTQVLLHGLLLLLLLLL